MKIPLLLLFILISCCADSQPLKTKRLTGSNNETATVITPTYDGGFLITGKTKTYTQGDWDIYLARYDHSLNLLWTKSIGTSAAEQPKAVMETAAHDFLIAYIDCPVADCNLVLVKLSESGNMKWTKAYYYNGESSLLSPLAVTETPGKNYAVLFDDVDYGFGEVNGSRFMLTDTSGNILSVKAVDHSVLETGSIITGPVLNGFIIQGGAQIGLINEKFTFITRIDTAGVLHWGTIVDGPAIDDFFAISKAVVTSGDGVLLVGRMNDYIAGTKSELIAKLDSSGTLQWSKSYTSAITDTFFFTSVCRSADNKYYLFGHLILNGDYKVLMAEVDLNGTFLWSKYIAIGENFQLSEAQVEPGGTAVIAGLQFDSGTFSDVIFLRTTLNATLNCFESPFTITSANYSLVTSGGFVQDTASSALITPPVLLSMAGGTDTLICEISSVENLENSNASMQLFPVPADQSIVISCPLATNTKCELKVRAVTGIELFSSTVTAAAFKLETENWPNGIYFVQLVSGKKTVTQKLIVQH